MWLLYGFGACRATGARLRLEIAAPAGGARASESRRRPSTVRSRIDGTPAVSSTSTLRERLQLAASVQLPDFFTFTVGEAMAELNQAPEGGARFPVDVRLDGRTFVRFHVDLGVGDDVLEPVEQVIGEDWLGFAVIRPVSVPALSAGGNPVRRATPATCCTRSQGCEQNGLRNDVTSEPSEY
jgi:hypothetical protein